mgnify:FL=1|jgi:hypothetical protein|tara:strand:- start:432 stop:680 length:249 start_codon:yes stop_codon:yes gene_type:complete
MKICTGRKTSYLNGMTFENCKLIAEEITEKIKPEIKQNGKMLWSELLEKANHDELIYKLTLKYLRRDGFNIGNSDIPEIRLI